ncbi:DUF4410 domain-containing protein [Pararobbsia alpina]|nr:DUF4410 domain-containing protein [Pararobbsia alpina]
MIRRSLRARVAVSLCVLLVAGCGGNNMADMVRYSPQQAVRPDTIYVYTFDLDPALVQTDHGMVATFKRSASGQSSIAAQATLATKVQEEVANEIVMRLHSRGLRAIHADTAAVPTQNILLVKGRFENVDSGNRARRVVIGLGAGKSQVGATVEISYQSTGGTPVLVKTFKASANSGRMPGMAETMGLGAAAGLAESAAAAGGVLHVTSETNHASPVSDAGRMADLIAKQIAQVGADEGWLLKAGPKPGPK